MNRILLLLLLLPVGPFCVAVLRFLLPYYTAGDEVATAQAVIDHPGRESAVLWLGLVAILTLLPGLITVAGVLPAGAWKTWAMALCIPGYLCLGPLLTQDYLLRTGAAAHLGAQRIGAEVAALHPSYQLATAIFVVGHVLGTMHPGHCPAAVGPGAGVGGLARGGEPTAPLGGCRRGRQSNPGSHRLVDDGSGTRRAGRQAAEEQVDAEFPGATGH